MLAGVVGFAQLTLVAAVLQHAPPGIVGNDLARLDCLG